MTKTKNNNTEKEKEMKTHIYDGTSAPLRISYRDFLVATQDGRKKTITVRIEDREGYNNTEMGAYIPSSHLVYLDAVDGKKWEDECFAEIHHSYIFIECHDGRYQRLERLDADEKAKERDRKRREYENMTAYEHEQAYLASIGQLDDCDDC